MDSGSSSHDDGQFKASDISELTGSFHDPLGPRCRKLLALAHTACVEAGEHRSGRPQMWYEFFNSGHIVVGSDVGKAAAPVRNMLFASFDFRLMRHPFPVFEPDGLQHEGNWGLRADFLG